MKIGKIISTNLKKTKLIVKILGLGSKDVQNCYHVLPFGIESNPSKNYRCIYDRTGVNGEKVIIGIIKGNTVNQGETKIYSEDLGGNEAIKLYLRSDGNMELGGNSDNLMRFSEMEIQVNQLKSDFNNFVSAFNQHVHPTAAVGAPSPPTPVPDVIPVSDTEIDISGSKIDELLTS